MTEAAVIPENVTPEGLRVRAELVRRSYNDESCARHLELAADEITKLKARQGIKNPLEDPSLEGTRYQTAIEKKTRESRLVIRRGEKILAYIVLDAEETYHLGTCFLRLYDKIEGI